MRGSGLRIVSGPVVAHLGPGDILAIEPGQPLSLLASPVSDVEQGAWPLVRVMPDGAHINGLVQVIDGRWHTLTQGEWRPTTTKTLTIGPWDVALVSDVDLIPTPRLLDGLHVGAPRQVGFRHRAGGPSSWWLGMVDGGGGEVMLLDVVRSGPRIERHERAAGLPVEDLDNRVDEGIARAVFAQLDKVPINPVIGFDGVVRGQMRPTIADVSYTDAAHHFRMMTGLDLSAAGRIASRDDVAAVVRALRPEAWAYEVAIREAAGLLLATQR